MKKYKLLSAIEFNQLVKKIEQDKRRLMPETLKLARQVLVDNESISDVARDNLVSRQLISRSVNQLFNYFEDLIEVPKDWVTIRTTLPPSEAKKVMILEKNLRRNLLK